MKKETKEIIKKIFIVGILVLIIATLFAIVNTRPTFADSGFSTSYGSGGSKSSGSSSSSSSSSSSRRDDDDDDRRSSSSKSYDSGSSSSSGERTE